jgi:hypothetical protein
MKCLCGYEGPFVRLFIGRKTKKRIKLCDIYNSENRRKLYACPKCGILKLLPEFLNEDLAVPLRDKRNKKEIDFDDFDDFDDDIDGKGNEDGICLDDDDDDEKDEENKIKKESKEIMDFFKFFLPKSFDETFPDLRSEKQKDKTL